MKMMRKVTKILSVELIEVPDSDIVSENASENVVQNATRKNKVQSKITSFFNAKN